MEDEPLEHEDAGADLRVLGRLQRLDFLESAAAVVGSSSRRSKKDDPVGTEDRLIRPAGRVPLDERIARVPVAERPRREEGEAQELLLMLPHAEAPRELFP